MLKLSKRAEYAILSLNLMSSADGQPMTVSEISEHYQLPRTLLAKVCQTLTRSGVVRSIKGAAGGYLLARPLDEISVADVLECFDIGVALVECVESVDKCQSAAHCDIRGPMSALSDAMLTFLRNVSLGDLLLRSPSFPETLSIFREPSSPLRPS